MGSHGIWRRYHWVDEARCGIGFSFGWQMVSECGGNPPYVIMLSLHIVADLVVVGCSCVVTNRTAILRHFPVQIHASQIPRDQNNAKLRITVHSHSSHSAMSLIYHYCSYLYWV